MTLLDVVRALDAILDSAIGLPVPHSLGHVLEYESAAHVIYGMCALRTWSVGIGDDRDMLDFARRHPRRYAALYVGLALVTWALKPKEVMQIMQEARLIRGGVSEDLADAILGMIGTAIEEPK